MYHVSVKRHRRATRGRKQREDDEPEERTAPDESGDWESPLSEDPGWEGVVLKRATFHPGCKSRFQEEFERFSNADFAMGHPECGNFSRLSSANKNAQEKLFDPDGCKAYAASLTKRLDERLAKEKGE